MSKAAIATIGPKISSRITRASWGTSASTTGAKKWPSPGTGPPATTTRAPRVIASSTSSERRATWRALIIGPQPTPERVPGPIRTAAIRSARRRVNSA